MLYIPGDSPGMIQHAPVFGADSILLDLEDAVALTEKDAARKMVACYLKDYDFKDLIVTVRVNGADTEFFDEDLDQLELAQGALLQSRFPARPQWAVLRLRHCLQTLTTKTRGMIEQRYFDDKNSSEIAADLKMKSSAVRRALLRAREALATCIAREQNNPSKA